MDRMNTYGIEDETFYETSRYCDYTIWDIIMMESLILTFDNNGLAEVYNYSW